ncbi:repressor LexA [Candidatus Gracilibacteria bacterium CG17_big_fil_post_rev_8_21_14_2_50_48_13]|nr:MAG: repressor LexA [Candidatus Gracilibacteria bacterium CG17_big_fil_post_rev_8_21_14_2_50_48_13]
MKPRLKEALIAIQRHLRKYGTSPSLRDLQKTMGYQSPRSAFLLVNTLLEEGLIEKDDEGNYKIVIPVEDSQEVAETISVPVLGSIACGNPIFAEENVVDSYPVSKRLLTGNHSYFFLRAEGDSMNQKGIESGDLVLVRQQNYAQSGDIVVALIDENATLKEYQQNTGAIMLIPHSDNPEHKPIFVEEGFLVQGVVVQVFKNIS